MDDCATIDAFLLDDIMDLHMLSLGSLLPKEPCCVIYTTGWEVYWGLTLNKNFFLVLWLDITHTNKDIYHTQGPRD